MKVTDKITITNEDNMELMARYTDNYFDLAIVDPPYFEDYGKKNYTGNDVSTTGVKRQTKKIKYWNLPDGKYFKELVRVSKNQVIWGCNYYCKYIESPGRIVWDKLNESSTFSKCELASHSFGVIVEKYPFMWNGMLQGDMANKEIRIHPTQKPVALYKWLLDKYAKPGDKILDTHLGSGSIAIACHDYGFELTACELDKHYYDAAIARIKRHTAQLSLFEPQELF
ncbi:DNA methyltransferase [Cruoricaptor ignavus]|uniref:DNA methyltransferase n=1 Tax=Cruoricaptor ignavus TaxID=1118202 RepID=UPI00370DD116